MNTVLGGVDSDTAQKLTAHINRIEELESDKKDTSELIKDEFTIAKSEGFEVKIMKMILKMRQRSADEIQEEEALLEIYKKALGMLV